MVLVQRRQFVPSLILAQTVFIVPFPWFLLLTSPRRAHSTIRSGVFVSIMNRVFAFWMMAMALVAIATVNVSAARFGTTRQHAEAMRQHTHTASHCTACRHVSPWSIRAYRGGMNV